MLFTIKKVLWNALTPIVFVLLTSVSHAEVYKWIDDDGKPHFTDKPPDDIQAEPLDLKINTYGAVQISPLVARLGRDDKVVMYSASWCGSCKRAKRYFKTKRIPYVVYDVENSRRGKMDFRLLKAKSVPVIIVGEKRMNGFTAARFDRLYRSEMKKREASAKKVDVN